LDFYDFMFPEQSEAGHLRRIHAELRASRRARVRQIRSAGRQKDDVVVLRDEVDALRADLEFVSMALLAVLKRQQEGERMSLADLSDLFGEIDALDGVADGGLDVDVLRGALGAVRAAEEEAPESGPPDDSRPPAPRRRLRRFRR
jgi:hypothetical protein